MRSLAVFFSLCVLVASAQASAGMMSFVKGPVTQMGLVEALSKTDWDVLNASSSHYQEAISYLHPDARVEDHFQLLSYVRGLTECTLPVGVEYEFARLSHTDTKLFYDEEGEENGHSFRPELDYSYRRPVKEGERFLCDLNSGEMVPVISLTCGNVVGKRVGGVPPKVEPAEQKPISIVNRVEMPPEVILRVANDDTSREVSGSELLFDQWHPRAQSYQRSSWDEGTAAAQWHETGRVLGGKLIEAGGLIGAAKAFGYEGDEVSISTTASGGRGGASRSGSSSVSDADARSESSSRSEGGSAVIEDGHERPKKPKRPREGHEENPPGHERPREGYEGRPGYER